MKEFRTHDITECKVEFSNIRTSSIKTESFDVSQDAPQRVTPNDNFIELKISNITPGVAYFINGIYIKTKYSNWSDSMQMVAKQASLLKIIPLIIYILIAQCIQIKINTFQFLS